MVWFIGFLAFVIYRVFNAGMKSKELFYSMQDRYNFEFTKKVKTEVFDGEKLLFYILSTVGFGLTWPISLPAVGIFLLGKRYAK